MAKTKKNKIGSKVKSMKSKSSDYVIAIPSYKREKTLRDKTLKVLQQYKIQKKRFMFLLLTKKNMKSINQRFHHITINLL